MTGSGRLDDAKLLVSELVTNAIRHARSPVQVTVRDHGGRLRVEVADESVRPLVYREGLQEGGRGLLLLDALADRWGVDHHSHGKTVWFELARRVEVLSDDGQAPPA